MKASIVLMVLISVIWAKEQKLKVKIIPPKKSEEASKKDLPDDIKQGEEFLKKSAAEFDKVKQLSAIQALQNSAMDQNWDLNIPQLENDLESENLAPVRQLNLKDKSKDESDKNAQKGDLNRKLEEEEEDNADSDENLDDVEKRLFSIEDKIDHLLLHAGHEVQPHSAVVTPWGLTYSPSKNNSKSLNNKLKIIDYLFGNHPMGHGMGGMGMGMGMGGMGYGMGGMGYGLGHGLGHGMMGIGHMNPMGVGLDHHASMKYGVYPYHMLHPVHPMHSFYPYGMYSPYHTVYGHHPIYGNLGYGHNSFSRYRDDLEEERHQRYMNHQRDMDAIMSKPLLPKTPLPDSLSSPSSSSIFLI